MVSLVLVFSAEILDDPPDIGVVGSHRSSITALIGASSADYKRRRR